MKTRTERTLATTCAAIVIAALGAQLAWSQDDRLEESFDSAQTLGAVSDEGAQPFTQPTPTSPTADIELATAKLRAAETPDDRETATAELKTSLEAYVDEDIRAREQELANIEHQLQQLREKLNTRKAKRDEIVDLQLRLLVNDADGLGFFRGGSYFPGGATGMMVMPGASGFAPGGYGGDGYGGMGGVGGGGGGGGGFY
ncbi:MAG: hypothetical protein R3C10_00860 [Pirellulales bacterium]